VFFFSLQQKTQLAALIEETKKHIGGFFFLYSKRLDWQRRLRKLKSSMLTAWRGLKPDWQS
jgi:hypothetical protein